MRLLNSNLEPYDYPIPLQGQHLDSFVGSNIFSSIDFRSGYWNIALDVNSRDVTSFSVPDLGKFRFCRLPQGCCVSAQYFAEILNYMLKDIRTLPSNLAKDHAGGLCNYFDDISVFADDFDTHCFLLRRLFTKLRDCNMSLNPSKSKFGYKKLKILGHIVEQGQISLDPTRIEAIKKIKSPRTLKECRKIHGYFSYMRKFIKNFSAIAAPITESLKTSVSFSWGPEQELALETLKKCFINAPPLKILNNKHKTLIKTDTSSRGIGVHLYQFCDQRNKYLPVAFASRLLTQAEHNMARGSSTTFEILAVVYATQVFRHYIAGLNWTLHCDNRAVVSLLNKKPSVIRHDHKLALFLLHLDAFDFEAKWVPSSQIADADFLSRMPNDPEEPINQDLTIEDFIAPVLTRAKSKQR